MCGIAGQYYFEGGRPDTGLLSEMSRRLAHRGPDGEGSYSDERCGLVHRRLAIIDLSADAAQPMTSEAGTLQLVFNGEIYNYIELREELKKSGHRFRSQSDAEVILHAYEEWGSDCVTRFNGMWAFAIWDPGKKELFCARDRFGIKPFYYTMQDGAFLFASEIKALLAHPAAGKKPDDETLATYLAWGVLDHGRKTMFSGISQLEPAHTLTVTMGGPGSPSRYWSVTVNPALHSGISDEETWKKIRGLLTDATRIHLRSDVAVGTCLSGGIDSSALTMVINRLIREEHPASDGDRQKTFSVVFSDPQFDESRYIDLVVAASGVDALRTEPAPEGLLDDIRNLVYMQDEPFGSLSIYAQYCVMRLASSRVKVVLDGQGADELLAGYLAYQGSYIRWLARSFRWMTAVVESAGNLYRHGGFFWSAFSQLRKRKRRRKLLKTAAARVDRYRGPFPEVLRRELTSTNLQALLHYEDRNSMAFSIESRVPYLDVRFVEAVAALPLNQKIREGVTKVALRMAIRGLVPDAVRCRRDKMGFVTPEEVWMKERLRPFMLDLFSSTSFAARPYWDAGAVVQDYLAFLDGRSAYSPEIWRIACTELWLRTFFDSQKDPRRGAGGISGGFSERIPGGDLLDASLP